MVSEWRSVTAESLNVGSVICLIKPAKLYMCMLRKHYRLNEDRCMALGVCSHGSIRLSHLGNVYKNWITTTLPGGCI